MAVAVSSRVRVGQRDRMDAIGGWDGGKCIVHRGHSAILTRGDCGLGTIHNRLDGGSVH